MAPDAPRADDPDEEAVSAWLRRLSERPDPRADVGLRYETPAFPTLTGPLELTPAPADEGLERDPLSEAYFVEAFRALQRAIEPKTDRQREVFEVLKRNIDCYLQFTRRRLAYLYQGLRTKDRSTFSVIPWLLHNNVPGTPGFQAGSNPARVYGVRDFDLNATMQAAVSEVFPRAMSQRAVSPQRPVIRSVLAMGSVGTIGHSGGSDFDYWVVYDEAGMHPNERVLFQRKVEAIESWAKDRGLDAHLYLVDVERARRNDFGRAVDEGESGGSAMGKLLKEEVYRTAVYLSGELPLWWVIPLGLTEPEHERLAGLITGSQAFIPGLSYCDLGYIATIEQQEFLGAGLWQINKSLKSPFKSLLKMALLSRYMNQARPTLLCDVLKKRVFEGERAPQFTDPYVLLFDAISEHYAALGDWTAFRLVQKCFYLKVGLKLSRDRRDKAAFMQRFRVMRAYIVRWGWERDLLADLDSMDTWSADRIDALGRAIRAFMLSTYRQLVLGARSSGADVAAVADEDLNVLGRRLYACFAAEPGKVEHLFTYFLKEPRVEERLVVLEVPQAAPNERWEVHRRLVRGQLAGRESSMFAAAELGEVAAWLVFNGLFSQGTIVGLIAATSRTSVTEFRHLLEKFSGMFESPDPFAVPPATFLAPRRMSRVALVVNLDLPREHEDLSDKAGVYYLPENWDILNYGRARQSQIVQVALVTVNNWGEMFCLRFTGNDALSRVVHTLFRRLDPRAPPEAMPEVFAPHGRQYQALRNRVGKLLSTLYETCVGEQQGSRCRAFAYEVGGRFQVIRREDARLTVVGARSVRGVVRQLGRMGTMVQETTCDHLSPSLSDLRALVDRARLDLDSEVLIGWRTERTVTRVLVRDESGRMFGLECPSAQADRVLSRLVRRVGYHVRSRVKTAADLRKLLRIYECRDGRTLGSQTVLSDDTARALTLLQLPRARKSELWLKGDLREGRQGLYFRLGNQIFGPRQFGRSFVFELVRRLLSEHTLYDAEVFTIDACDVNFGETANGKDDAGSVGKQLRLVQMAERWIVRALASFQGAAGKHWRRTTPFRGGFPIPGSSPLEIV